MMHMLLGNIEPGTTDHEIRDLLVKYGFPPFDEITFIEGDGSRPAAALTFRSIDAHVLTSLQSRLHNMYWKNRQLSATVGRERFI
ncbi:RNA-binding protein [Paraburkholderia acidipaludis]|uniref:RNA-binding protein n=1 Tax=Paraburkholderia acidipaludis TaxID=660537 RepID=UPI000489CDFB|nr:RNA-binding protein [Paraburkholderia acidipaludis]